jgi:hypothetical protein
LHYRRARLALAVVLQVVLDPLHRVSQIGLVDNVVAVENRASLVAADGHCYPFGHASAHHVANSRPAQIVEDAADVPYLTLAGRATVPTDSLFTANADELT